jgi:hypothetical protein
MLTNIIKEQPLKIGIKQKHRFFYKKFVQAKLCFKFAPA